MNLNTNEVSYFIHRVTGKGFFHGLSVAKPFSFEQSELKLTSYLHDAVEDGHITENELTSELLELFPDDQDVIQNVMANVMILTRGSDELYSDYIQRVIPYENARLVKLSDMAENMQRSVELEYDAKFTRSIRYAEHLPLLISNPMTEQEKVILVTQNPTAFGFLNKLQH